MAIAFEDVYLFPQALDRSASRWPEAEVFRCRGESVSFSAFADHVGRVAGLLAEHGVSRGDRVGLMMPKSIESAIGLYAVMACGAAYVPIDPTVPPERLRFILEDCAIAAMIVHERTAPALRKQAVDDLRVVVGAADDLFDDCPSFDWPEALRFPRQLAAHPRACEDDLAYIMYTSGSTGQPKGLMHTHRSGLTYARQSARLFELGPTDRLGNHSPLHFDMSTLDYFSGPLYGAATVIIPEEYLRVPASLSGLVEKERLTIWYSVPFAIIQLIEHGLLERRDLGALRWILFGGEPFSPRYVRRLMDLLPDARIGNVYGPAEVNQCTFYEVPADLDGEQATIPIGQAWENTDCLVVDEDDRPVEPGGTGELLVRTPTMMQGYWRRPDLNEKAFHHLIDDGGRALRYFRTGDLVSLDAGGSMSFLGRKDRQIKLRGYRVELDEIELAAYQCPGVEEAAVVALKNGSTLPEICLAVIPGDGAALDAAAIRRELTARLPAYALPSRIVVRSDFPRTGSEKIDRTALGKTLEQESN